jgi:hypothetical protein
MASWRGSSTATAEAKPLGNTPVLEKNTCISEFVEELVSSGTICYVQDNKDNLVHCSELRLKLVLQLISKTFALLVTMWVNVLRESESLLSLSIQSFILGISGFFRADRSTIPGNDKGIPTLQLSHPAFSIKSIPLIRIGRPLSVMTTILSR